MSRHHRNKNAIPFDTNPPMKRAHSHWNSGSLRAHEGNEMRGGQVDSEALHNRTDKTVLTRIRREVLGCRGVSAIRFAPAKHAEREGVGAIQIS